MKRAALIRHLESHGCVFVREGSKHTVYRNPANGSSTTIPRHREIKKQLARKICMDRWHISAIANDNHGTITQMCFASFAPFVLLCGIVKAWTKVPSISRGREGRRPVVRM
jgi:predicted RNA binding protein YcfA (HicA-like mRNA interferase family)